MLKTRIFRFLEKLKFLVSPIKLLINDFHQRKKGVEMILFPPMFIKNAYISINLFYRKNLCNRLD